MWRLPSTSIVYLGPFTIPAATSSMTIDIAVIPRGVDEPADADWRAADIWDGTQAFLKIGPTSGLPLADGIYQAFVRVHAGTETPVIEVDGGIVRIT